MILINPKELIRMVSLFICLNNLGNKFVRPVELDIKIYHKID